MEYTRSSEFVTHTVTGQRMHEDRQAVPTIVSANDLNMIIWSLMEIIKAAGMEGTEFNPDNPASYQKLLTSLGTLYANQMEFETVPASYKDLAIIVTTPHLRMMIWDAVQGKYVRAPWHQPCQLIYTYDNPASIPGALPVRGDLSYDQANYPDVVGRLGLSGVGTFTLVDARGEFLRVLDNGRGVDVGRVLGSAQIGAVQSHKHNMYFRSGSESSSGITDATGFLNVYSDADMGMLTNTTAIQSEGSDDGRPRNTAFPLWMTY